MKDKKLILRFSGDKLNLHKQLKMWCLKADESMNGTVVELIERLIKDTKFAKTHKEWKATQK